MADEQLNHDHGDHHHAGNSGGTGHDISHEGTASGHHVGPDPINWFSTSYTGGCAGKNAQFANPPLGFAIFNFSLLIAGIIWAVKKNRVGASLKASQDEVREHIEIATRMREEAEAKLADVKRRSDALESELDKMSMNAKKAAEAEKIKILADAKLEAERLQRQGTRAIEQEFKKAQASLATDTLSLACSMAQGILTSEVNATDHGRLQDQFIAKLLSSKAQTVGRGSSGGTPTGGDRGESSIMTDRTSTTIPAVTQTSVEAPLSSSRKPRGASV